MAKNRKPIRVVTINTWKGDGAYTKRLAALANQLRLLKPDVVCLQEALQSADGRLDTTGYLARSLNLQPLYAPARQKIRTVEGKRIDCHSGLAVLTSLTICGSSIARLPSVEQDKRISLTVEMEAGGNTLVVTNVHLTHIEAVDALRRSQLIAAIEHGQPLDYSATWLCCGDFNCSLDEEDLRRTLRPTDWLPFDCYTAGGGELPGITLPGEDQTRPGRRIDYILGLVREEADTFPCDKSQVVLNYPDSEGDYPSDHFGVMAEITPRIRRRE